MKFSPVLLGLSLAVAGSSLTAAQDASTSSIPAVLQITREYVKPYKNGMAHDKTESAFVAAFTKAKYPAHYIGLSSMSGRSRSLFLTQYSSFAELEKVNKILDKNPTLGADLERAGLADGDLLDQLDTAVFTYDAELSYHPHADISHARYFEIEVFHVRPGRLKEWYTNMKMYKDVMDKGNPSAHWATFEVAYGAEGGTYVCLTAYSSLAEIDQGIAAFPKVLEAAGGLDGLDKQDKIFGEAVDTYRTELFSVNPRQSYVSDEWIKSDIEFWKPKAAKATPESAATKPAAKPAPPAAKPASR